jgi:hypothetical protein
MVLGRKVPKWQRGKRADGETRDGLSGFLRARGWRPGKRQGLAF